MTIPSTPWPPDRAAHAIARICKVNHAGEYGAIRIYGAQIFVSRLLWPRLTTELGELRAHEIQHCRIFKEAMPSRGARPCRIMPLWSVGGWVLGFVTALLGPRAIWACTEAVEATVHRHLNDQIAFLANRDERLRQEILAIRDEEEGHLTLARERMGARDWLARRLYPIIEISVDGVIWLSTWGESAKMVRDLDDTERQA
ncbi:MAG: demethoxyubiquinone hydroxylase family protein [Rhodobacteraceae bacterium]|nr:demethoxyubiquinone hydroxylase family protein [Paracoccaceae bacterium]